MIRRPARLPFLLLLAALWAALLAPSGPAEAADSADPFRGLDAIRLSATVGGPLDLQGGTSRELFADDLRRFNRFLLDLTTALETKLGACGLFVSQEVADELVVEVFGRREELRQCAPRYVYMVQAKVLNSKRGARPAPEEFVYFPPVIGLADEAGLERALIDAAVATVAGELRSCRP